MFILPLSRELTWLNTTIDYSDISIETWIQLMQNKFIGIGDVEFTRQRYNLDVNQDLVSLFKKVYKEGGIFVFLKESLTRELWYTVKHHFKNVIIIAITYKTSIDDENILEVNSIDDIYQRDKICRHFNKYLLKNK